MLADGLMMQNSRLSKDAFIEGKGHKRRTVAPEVKAIHRTQYSTTPAICCAEEACATAILPRSRRSPVMCVALV